MRYDLTLHDIEQARRRVMSYIRQTPLLPMPLLHTDLPSQLRLKLENLQVSGSFKARGAFNNLLQFTPAQRKRGIIVASGGNHGLAIAYAAATLDIPATVYLPTTASADRAERIAAWGAQVQRYGDNPSDALSYAQERAEQEQRLYVHPFDAERTLHGTGTLGLELLDDVPELDCVLIAIGGGGLISGMSAAIKQRRPDVHIIGVEPVGAAKMQASLQAQTVVELPQITTIADTLAPRVVSERTLALTSRYVDDVVLVEDSAMIEAMRWLWTECNQLVEPSGAAVIAAIQSGVAKIDRYRHPVALICGGNAAAESVFSLYQLQTQQKV
ncbi:MAG: threonine/serine dehydratase [Chloroflexota bacterium]